MKSRSGIVIAVVVAAIVAGVGAAGGSASEQIRSLVSQAPAAAAKPEVTLLPGTVEEYWNGQANCLASQDELDTVASATVGILQRYSEPTSKSFGNFRLKSRPRILVNALDELTTAIPQSEVARLAAGCPTTYCAVSRIFGDPSGLRLLYLLTRYQYNASHYSDLNSAQWSPQELADILLALGDLPDAVAPFYGQEQRALLREVKNDRLARLAPGTNGNIVAISSPLKGVGIRASKDFGSMPANMRRASVFHEIAHDFFRQQSKLIDAHGLWQRAAIADEMYRQRTGRSTSSVSRYAQSSIEEDFAESAVAYRYAPELIMKRAPNRARLLRTWYFDGLSYDTPEGCDPGRSLSARATRRAFEIIPTLSFGGDEFAIALSQCQWRLRDDASSDRVTNGRLCIGREIYRYALAASLRQTLPQDDPVSRAMRTSRETNDRFIEHVFGTVSDAQIMSLTDSRAIESCGSACHRGDSVRG